MESLARKTRMKAGVGFREAARKLGIPEGYLSEIELGKKMISAQRASEIATLYGVAIDEIFLPSRYALREVVKESG